MDGRGREAEAGRKVAPDADHVLAAEVEVQAARLDTGDGGSGFERGGGDAVVDEGQGDGVGGGSEGGGDGGRVAAAEAEGEVAGGLGPEERGAGGQGVGRVGDGLDVVVGDNEQLRRVAGRSRGFGDDEGHRLAHVAHVAGREGVAGWDDEADLGREGHGAGQGADAAGVQVRGGEDAGHAGKGGRGGVDGAQHGVGVGGAHEHGVELAGCVAIVHVAPGAAQEAGVLGAAMRPGVGGVQRVSPCVGQHHPNPPGCRTSRRTGLAPA